MITKLMCVFFFRCNASLLTFGQGQKYRVLAYDSSVKVVEPEVSLLDYKLYVLQTVTQFSASDPFAAG